VLAAEPDRQIVIGAYTQPWHEQVTFHPLPPEQFAGFDQPGYVKIVWMLGVEPLRANRSLLVTRTRAVGTDPHARRMFRRYWRRCRPGSSSSATPPCHGCGTRPSAAQPTLASLREEFLGYAVPVERCACNRSARALMPFKTLRIIAKSPNSSRTSVRIAGAGVSHG
jgi:hypothetical protein